MSRIVEELTSLKASLKAAANSSVDFRGIAEIFYSYTA